LDLHNCSQLTISPHSSAGCILPLYGSAIKEYGTRRQG
jgi:hypothetical protein